MNNDDAILIFLKDFFMLDSINKKISTFFIVLYYF